MKKMILAALLAAAAANPAAAQTVPAAQAPAAARTDADPALWVVRDNDTTIYLFGTFHALDGSHDWFNDEVRTAFDRSQELVIEVLLPENPAELQPVVMRYATDAQGRTLSSRLNEQERTALRNALQPLGADPAMFDRFEPWFISLTLTQIAAQRLGLTPEHGPETILRRAANQRNMPVSALETAEGQIQVLDRMSEAEQLKGLREVLANPDRLRETLQPMLAAWSSGDTEGLVRILNESLRENPESYRVLFTERNTAWARWVRERMARPGTVFMAVGGGHLGGPGSVQEQLQGMNIRSERVPSAG